MNKYTRRAEVYWNYRSVETPPIQAGSLPIEYSPWTKWDGWPDTGKIAVPKLIFTPPDNYIFGDNNKPSMDCCDEIQSKIDSLQKELIECRLDKKVHPALADAKRYFQNESYVGKVSYNDESEPNSILVDIHDSTMSYLHDYVSAHSELYIYNVYRPTSASRPSPTVRTFARIVISLKTPYIDTLC